MRSERHPGAWLLTACLLLLAGCRPYVMSNSAVEQYPSAEQEIDFLSAVERMPAVTNNDALHGFLMLQDGADPHATYEARAAEGRRRGWFMLGVPRNPNEAAKVGWMATAGCTVMQVKGGLTMHLFGPAPRYATRELVYMEILPLRTENQILTGAEFVDFLNRLDRIAGRNRREVAPSPLGEPAGHGVARDDQPSVPLGTPAGASVVSPGNEAAIQEGPLPDTGTLQEPDVTPPAEQMGPPAPEMGPPTPQMGPPAPEPAPQPAPEPVPPPQRPPSTVPGTMSPTRSPPAPSQK
jgi:hypothetical protein